MTRKPSFSDMAARLRANGWQGLIPLRPRSKAPAIKEWERFNGGQSADELDALCRLAVSRTPWSGVGACAGNGVLFVDLDILDAQAQERAQAIVEDLFDITPLYRIGRPPKAALLYRSDAPGLRRNPRGLAVEIYGGGRPATGQVVIAGIHPDIGRPYHYPRHRPSEVPLAHLPYVHPEQVDLLEAALARDPLIKARGMIGKRLAPARLGSGLLAMAHQARATPGGHAAWVSSQAPGGRHCSALAAVLTTIRAGLEPDEEVAALEVIEIAFKEAKPEAPPEEWRDIMRWARKHARPYTRAELFRRLGVGGNHG